MDILGYGQVSRSISNMAEQLHTASPSTSTAIPIEATQYCCRSSRKDGTAAPLRCHAGWCADKPLDLWLQSGIAVVWVDSAVQRLLPQLLCLSGPPPFSFQERKKNQPEAGCFIQNCTMWLTAGVNLVGFSLYKVKIPSSSLDALLSAARAHSKLNAATTICICCSINDRFRGTGFEKRKERKQPKGLSIV